VLRCGFTPVDKKLVRRFTICACACAIFFFILQILLEKPAEARPDALQDCVERLAKKAAALPHERRMSLVWTNHAALSDARAERLRMAFAERLEAAQVRLVEGETAPALRVTIEQTPSRMVFTAIVPGEGSSNVAIEEIERALAGMEEGGGNRVRLEKELLWQQETRILSAALLPAGDGGEKRLAVLTEDTLQIYGGAAGNWKLESSKALPGPRAPQRSARGLVIVVEDKSGQIAILLPGKRCQASVAGESTMTCATTGMEWPAGRLMATSNCGVQTWWLRSDGGDLASEDRLLLRNAGNGQDATPVAEMGIAGPAISIGAGESAGSATVTARNLRTGNYEVYRVAVACGE